MTTYKDLVATIGGIPIAVEEINYEPAKMEQRENDVFPGTSPVQLLTLEWDGQVLVGWSAEEEERRKVAQQAVDAWWVREGRAKARRAIWGLP